ncbi:alpha/beta hydrolase [bacterium]|nr:alpha/beta hydrolase [bacterium]
MQRRQCLHALLILLTFSCCETLNAQQNQTASSHEIEVVRNVAYVTDEHERQRLDLYLPTNRSAEQLPLIVYIHGGAWQNGDKAGGNRFVNELVASGKFVGASINYRLSHHAIWPAQIHDCKAAIRWLKGNAEKYGIDPERIGVIGTSAGGHLVAMLGTTGGVKELEGKLGEHLEQSSRVAAVVDFFGPTELLTMNGFPGKMDHNAPNSPESKLMGGPIQKLKEQTNAASPIHYVSTDDARFLIIHGTEDPLVPFDQSRKFDELLDKTEVSSTLITIEGGGHGGFRSKEVDEIVSKFWNQQLYKTEILIPEVVLKQPRR